MPDALQLALLIAILLPASKLAASLCTRFGIPAILGELLVGVAAGPGALNLLHRSLFRGNEANSAFLLLAQIGGLVLMFIAGLETDIERMREASATAFLVALSGVVWPFFLGAAAAHALGLPWDSAWFLGGALTATSVSISARTLMDAGRMASPEATVILGAAVIDDVMGLFVLAFLAASAHTGSANSFGFAARMSSWLRGHTAFGAAHPLLTQMLLIGLCSLDRFDDRVLLDPLPIRKVNASVSPQLEEILQRALERDPAHRYGSAREFAHDLAHPESIQFSKNKPSRTQLARQSSAAASRNLILYSLLLIPLVLFLLIYLFSLRR